MARNITEEITELIAVDNQLISMAEDQGFLQHLDFLNPWYALHQHYITLLSSYSVPVCALVSWVKQHIHFILRDNVRNM